MKSKNIIIKGAKQHNLKNINIEIPKNKFVVITGLSGSGKSSLAFDTLYAEGQRRYVESLSTYARQFLGQMEKPDVDSIEGLSPAIAIQQKTASHNPRSTVGTITEIYDYLRLLFARIGISHCYKCGKTISSQTVDQMVDKVMEIDEGTKAIILSPIIANQKGAHEKTFRALRQKGFARVQIDGKTYEIEDITKLDKNKKHTINVIIDRFVIKQSAIKRITDSMELAVSLSNGLAMLDIFDSDKSAFLFSEKSVCHDCSVSYLEFTPASFSFNSPQGACPKCGGLGFSTEFDPDLIVPNQDLSLRDGAVSVWADRNSVHFFEFIDALTKFYDTDIYTPFKNFNKKFKKVLMDGSGNTKIPFYFEKDDKRYTFTKTFEGIIPNLKKKYLESNSNKIQDDIKKYLNQTECKACSGTRLNKASSSVKVYDKTIHQISSLTVSKALSLIATIKLTGKDKIIAAGILKEINDRLYFLKNVGLNYLTLKRHASTLSGGEAQRIRLATQLGSKLTGVLYVLDEPSIGLHQRDNQRLLETLFKMRDLDNTILVVEHDKETIMSADHLIDMGPGAGIKGGHVVFSGHPKDILKEENSLTGQYFSGKKSIEIPKKRRPVKCRKIIIKGAGENNLQNIDVKFHLGRFNCVTGVSGSGKSTLVTETLYKILYRKLYASRISTGIYKSIEGLEHLDKVINIDQSPIGRTPRSNPGTYTGVLGHIRELFAKTPQAMARGFKPGRFSFNVKGGRCEACKGEGIIKIEMHFLPDIYVSCDLCNGKRYNRETLEILYKGKNISEILSMTVNQTLAFFTNIPLIKNKLETLVNVGLGYIQIGQAATTLSGGEAQRIKLSRELSKRGTGKTVYILDEPTTGLHVDDINKLLLVLNRLVDAGNTVIVIEHNLDIIKCADYVIDLGPEGGEKGGMVIACGSPEDIANTDQSYTGKFLKDILNKK